MLIFRLTLVVLPGFFYTVLDGKIASDLLFLEINVTIVFNVCHDNFSGSWFFLFTPNGEGYLIDCLDDGYVEHDDIFFNVDHSCEVIFLVDGQIEYLFTDDMSYVELAFDCLKL